MSYVHIFKEKYKLMRNKLPPIISADYLGSTSCFKDFGKGLNNPVPVWFKGDRIADNRTGVVINYRKWGKKWGRFTFPIKNWDVLHFWRKSRRF